jgi:hypothetical protein
VLGRSTGRLVDPALGQVLSVVAGANGAISGWRGIYRWRRPSGLTAFVLDSTWGSLPMAGSLASHGVAALRPRSGYVDELSHRRNRHVYRGGARLKRGFALTLGNVVSGAGDVDDPRRRRLVEDHEDVHVWQARWLGPLFVATYALWYPLGGVAGFVTWLRRGRRDPLGRTLETFAYYLNPLEWWAYSRDGRWPPRGMLTDLAYRRAAARPLADVRAGRPGASSA